MSTVRRTYKDSLFRDLFGSEERRGNALELYNALAGTSYDDPEELEITTISDVIFLGRKNDVSFIVGNEMVLLEHQSTHNPNMPLRGLLYFSRLYGKYVDVNEVDIYGHSLQKLPTPRYVVLYFGTGKRPEREVMRLSDSFVAGPGDLEVTATVLNCNEGRNQAIMQACETLRGYAHLLALARKREAAGMDLRAAVHDAVFRCIDEGVLADYLTAHREEAEEMLFTTEDEERAMRVHYAAVEREAREKGFDEGRSKGLDEGRAEALADSVKAIMASAQCDAAAAMDMLQVPEAERAPLTEALKRNRAEPTA